METLTIYDIYGIFVLVSIIFGMMLFSAAKDTDRRPDNS